MRDYEKKRHQLLVDMAKLKDEVSKNKYVVTVLGHTPSRLGISQSNLRVGMCLLMLYEGYRIYRLEHAQQILKILAPPGTTFDEVRTDRDLLKPL